MITEGMRLSGNVMDLRTPLEGLVPMIMLLVDAMPFALAFISAWCLTESGRECAGLTLLLWSLLLGMAYVAAAA